MYLKRETENTGKKQREIDEEMRIVKSRNVDAEEACNLKMLEVSEFKKELAKLERKQNQADSIL